MGGEVSPDGWNRLWAGVRPDPAPPHPVDLATLGEYAVLLRRRGSVDAARAFPGVAAHLQTNCSTCARELAELTGFVDHEIRGELALHGVGLRRGALFSLLPQYRGRPPEPPVSAESPRQTAPDDLPVSIELVRRAIAEGDGATRRAVVAGLEPIVTTWVRRASPRVRPSDEVDHLTRHVFDRFWATLTPERLANLADIVGIVRFLRETTTSVLQDHSAA